MSTGFLSRAGLIAAIATALAMRLWHVDQPIVENYVGRQIPTAMVARNIERGSGVLRPQLETGPFPNYFLVEPPIFEVGAVLVRAATGIPLDAAGRTLSAMATALGCWALFGLVRRRQGEAVAFASIVAFAALPITIRYGRAFQADMLMLGAMLAGLRRWDDYGVTGRRIRLIESTAWLVIALCAKVVVAWSLVLLFVDHPRLRRQALAVAGLAAMPVILWYVHAALLLGEGAGSRASADSGRIWLNVLVPSALLEGRTYVSVGRFLLLRGFTPLVPLALWGLLRGDRYWRIGGIAAGAMLVALAGKLHHEYYFLALAPAISVGYGTIAVAIAGRWGAVSAAGLASAFLLCAAMQARSTFETPEEWRGVRAAAAIVQRRTSPGELVVASEAFLYYCDRRGCRLETEPRAVERAAGEWRAAEKVTEPSALVALYRSRGARWFADRPSEARGAAHRALHAAIRAGYIVLNDSGELLLADLSRTRGPAHVGAADGRDGTRLRPLENRRAEDHGADGLRLHDRPPAR